MTVVPLDKKKYGHFHSGDSYILLYVSFIDKTERGWIGIEIAPVCIQDFFKFYVPWISNLFLSRKFLESNNSQKSMKILWNEQKNLQYFLKMREITYGIKLKKNSYDFFTQECFSYFKKSLKLIFLSRKIFALKHRTYFLKVRRFIFIQYYDQNFLCKMFRDVDSCLEKHLY